MTAAQSMHAAPQPTNFFFGWSLRIDQTAQAELVPQIRQIVCTQLNLCASVGCSCVTGSADPALCYESSAGRNQPIHHSEGPTWAVYIRCLPEYITIDVHAPASCVPAEVSACHAALAEFGYALWVHGGGTFG